MAELLDVITSAGLGELPGEDPVDAAAIAVGEAPELPSVPVLPARGPWAGGPGRASAFLAELHVDLQPGGWRVVPRAGIDERRRNSALRADLDAFEEALANASATAIKTSAYGPWSLAALLERTNLGPMLADPGAVRDITGSLTEGLVQHVAELRRRFGREVVIQLEEPVLSLVAEGGIATTSGLDRIAAVEATTLQSALRDLRTALEQAGAPVIVREPGREPAIELLRGAGFTAYGLEVTALGRHLEEQLAAIIEGGGHLLVAVADPSAGATPKLTLREVIDLWRRLGLDPALGPRSVVVSHHDGAVGRSRQEVLTMLKAAREAGQWMAAEPEEWMA